MPLKNAFLIVFLAGFLTACAAPSRLPAVPESHTLRAQVLDIPDSRFWLRPEDPTFVRIVNQAIERAVFSGEWELHKQQDEDSILVLSSGSDGGAFASGLLNGWTAEGTRPEFSIVTGVSTGALIAPFAFIGPEYDEVLRDVYLKTHPKNIHKPRGVLMSLTSDAYSDTAPLMKQIRSRMDEPLLQRVAEEYAKGKLLLIGTTNLDSREAVVWNMGAIASSGHPDALELFRKIVLASASVPGFFPPVMIEVSVNGKMHEEMHVDGGTTGQVFAYPAWINRWSFDQEFADVFDDMKTSIYVVRNSTLKPRWSEVPRRTVFIGYDAIKMLTHALGSRDIDRIYYQAAEDGLEFNLAYIDDDFDAEHPEDFDNDYMKALYDYGYQKAVGGFPWLKRPPGMGEAEIAR